MERKKQARLFSLLLAGVLLINTIPTPAFAEEIPETPDTVQTEEPAPEESPAEVQEPAAVVTDEIPVLSEETAETEETPVLTPEEAPEAEQEEVSNEESDPVSETDEENMTAEEAVSDAAAEETEEEAVAEEETAEEDSEAETEEEEKEEEINYPAVTLRETVEGVTVTLSAPEGSLPEGVRMTVEPVHEQAVFAAVDEVLAEEGKSLANAVAFDITLYDTEGNELQPNDFVKVSFSNTDLSAPAEESEISVYRVSDDASEVTPVTTVAANDNNQLFITDHFTIYVSGKGSAKDPNGDGSYQANSQSHRLYLDFGETIDLASTGDSWIHDVWYIRGVTHVGAITQDGESSKFTNTNVWNSYAAATICHEYGFNPFSYDVYTYEYFFVSLRPQSSFPVTFNFCDVGQTEFTVEQKDYYAVDRIITPPVHETSKYVDGKLYIFSGWCSDKECTKSIPSSAFYGLKQSITAYAKYSEASEKYAIVFHGNAPDVTSVPAPQYSSYNVFDNITKEYPERPGYLFGDWAASPDGKPEYSHYNYQKITVPEDTKVLNLYATWKEREAYVSYDTYDYANRRNWGTRSLSYELLSSISGTAKGSTATPAAGYRFVRWVDKNGATVSEEPKFVPQKVGGKYYADATYYAVFEPITHTVTFNTNGGTAIAAQTVNQGAKVTRPSDPTKDSCNSFLGWYSDKELNIAFDFVNTKVTSDITIYAKWNHTSGNLEHILPKEAGCITGGNKEYWHCRTCERYYSDANGQKEISAEEIVISPLGHKPGNPVPVPESYQFPTCDRTGSHVEVVSCTECSTELTRTTVIDDALGHDWGEWATTREPTESTPGERTRHCTRVSSHVEHETIPIIHEHTLGNLILVERIEPLCTKQGKKAHYKCSRCPKLFWDAEGKEQVLDEGQLGIRPNGHKKMTFTPDSSIVPATCTTDGHAIQFTKCNDCGAILDVSYIELPALGHDWERTEYTAPTCTTEGHAKGVCKRADCHAEEEFTLPALGHKETVLDIDVIKEATCTEDGKQIVHYNCARCQEELSHVEVTLPALEHNWGKWVTVKSATDSEPGLEVRICQRDPSHRETREIPPTDEDSSETEVKNTPAASILYYLGSGGGSTWYATIDQSLVFTFKRYYSDEETFHHFLAIDVDGQFVDPSNYTAAPGSVVITLNNTYLKTLSPGWHQITAYFDDGNPVTTEFYINAGRRIPKTSDDSRLLLWALLELCSLCAVLISVHMLRTSD